MRTNFDELATKAFSSVRDLMGENATWLSSISSSYFEEGYFEKGYFEADVVSQCGKILFKDPTEPVSVGGDYEYRPNAATAEFYEDTFVGLKETSDNPNNQEILIIRGSHYFVREVNTKFDGRTYIAHLEPVIHQSL